MIWTVGALFAVAFAAPWVHRALGRRAGMALAFVPLAIAVYYARTLTEGSSTTELEESFSWVPYLGVDVALRLDGLAGLFSLLVCGIGGLIILYAGGYLGQDMRLGRLHGYLFFFMASMLGLVLSDDLITLFVFWELTSISSYLLIGFDHEKAAARDAARKALLVTGAGGLALLAGLVIVALAGHHLGLSPREALKLSSLSRVDLTTSPLYPAAFLLVLVGALTKSAQFPFHFWLPSAMAAPTPVSAYLHSATMVKAGVYLLARLQPHLGGTDLWVGCVTSFGAVTMVVGGLWAATQRDLKRILAFSTVSVLGTLTMLIGVGTDTAIKAAVVFVAAHALYKAALFMVAGNVDHEAGTRDVLRLGGLARVMPFTALAGGLAALSKAGAPPLFGFMGKELLYAAKLDLEAFGNLLIVVAVVANVCLTATALVVAVWPFFGKCRHEPRKQPHEAPLSMLVGPVTLAILGLFVGLIPGVFDRIVGSGAASSMAGESVEMKLKLWHGLNPEALAVLGLSAVTLGVGFLFFVRFRPWLARVAKIEHGMEAWGMAAAYEKGLGGLDRVASWHTRLLQNGYLGRYLLTILIATCGMLAVPAVSGVIHVDTGREWPIRLYEAILAGVTLAGALLAVVLRSRLAGVAALGVTGIAVALLFASFSAPDLAITQIMVETLTVILLVLLFFRLPPVVAQRPRIERATTMAVAAAAGLAVTMLVLAATSATLEPEVSRHLSKMSVPEAQGQNIVNVILVDFRALDTLGEITVVAAAGLGVYALLRSRRALSGEEKS